MVGASGGRIDRWTAPFVTRNPPETSIGLRRYIYIHVSAAPEERPRVWVARTEPNRIQ